jgi:predicted HicB family RNase H-like nuclease
MKLNNCIHYKGYIGTVVFSEEDAVFHGKVIGIKPLISFEGDNVTAITKDFRDAIEEYLDFCANNNITPEKSFKGSFNVRIGSDLHRKAAIAASAKGMTLNAFVEDAIRKTVAI